MNIKHLTQYLAYSKHSVNGRYYYFCFFLQCHEACLILVPQPGIELMLPALEGWRFNHWTTREVSNGSYYYFYHHHHHLQSELLVPSDKKNSTFTRFCKIGIYWLMLFLKNKTNKKQRQMPQLDSSIQTISTMSFLGFILY